MLFTEREPFVHSTAHSGFARSEEHTSELQSQSNLVCRLLLEKKKYQIIRHRATKLPWPVPAHLYPPRTPPSHTAASSPVYHSSCQSTIPHRPAHMHSRRYST